MNASLTGTWEERQRCGPRARVDKVHRGPSWRVVCSAVHAGIFRANVVFLAGLVTGRSSWLRICWMQDRLG